MVVILKSGCGAKVLCPFAIFHQNQNIQQSTLCHRKQEITIEKKMLQYKAAYSRRVQDNSSSTS